MCVTSIISKNKKNSIIICIYLYICPHISHDIVYMYMLLYLMFTFVRFARGNKIMRNNEKVAYVKQKYSSIIGYAIMYQVWCDAKQCKNNKQT